MHQSHSARPFHVHSGMKGVFNQAKVLLIVECCLFVQHVKAILTSMMSTYVYRKRKNEEQLDWIAFDTDRAYVTSPKNRTPSWRVDLRGGGYNAHVFSDDVSLLVCQAGTHA